MASRILETGKEAFTVWQRLRAGVKVRLWDGLLSLGVWKDGLKVVLADCAVIVGKPLNGAPVRGLTLAVIQKEVFKTVWSPTPPHWMSRKQ